MKRNLYNEDHETFRGSVGTFLDRKVVPYVEQWEDEHLVNRQMWRTAAQSGIIGLAIPEEFGGGGVSEFRFEMVRAEEVARRGVAAVTSGWGVSDGIVPGYLMALGTQAQKEKYLTGLTSGAMTGAIAMTEPDAGSDLQAITTKAVRDGDDWIINGAKTFITNGIHCNFVIVVARTNAEAKPSQGTSLFIVDAGTPGFEKGRKLKKLGMDAQDTAELTFTDVRVPADARLGELDQGFVHLMVNLPTERLLIGSGTLAGARAALEFPIARAFKDNRIQAIFGGANEVMKELIGREIAKSHGRR